MITDATKAALVMYESQLIASSWSVDESVVYILLSKLETLNVVSLNSAYSSIRGLPFNSVLSEVRCRT